MRHEIPKFAEELARMTPGQFAFQCAVVCLCEGVHPMATIREGLLEALSHGSSQASVMLFVLDTPHDVIQQAMGRS